MPEGPTPATVVLVPLPVPSACPLPRVTIQFCTQCKWMLRAAYYAQELLSTFSTSLGEVALQPSTGGTFIVTIYHSNTTATATSSDDSNITTKILWDRKTDLGFPETKELKRRVRDVIEPGRNLGHVDRDHRKEDVAKIKENTTTTTTEATTATATTDEPSKTCEVQPGGQHCEDCN